MSDFIHLHNHSHYSLLDGAASIDKIVERVSSLGMKSFALTDHGNMFGAAEFATKAKKAGIKPIIGMEAYISHSNMLERTTPTVGKRNYHLVLLAKNDVGYRNLMKLSSIGYLEGFYFNPRIDKDTLRKYSEGLVASSACLSGEVTYFASQGDYDKAKSIALEYLEIFGEGNFFLELQRHKVLSTSNDLEREAIAREVVKKISKDTGIPMVATNDAHYVDAAHHSAHDALICIGHGKYINDVKRMRYDTDDIYIKTQDQMIELFQDVPSAIENTQRISEMCNFEMQFGTNYMPQFPLPPGVANLNDLLDKKVYDGLEKRIKKINTQYKERVEYELGVIKSMGFPGYFLITQDFIMYAKNNGIPVGPGRGSAAGSLVAYALHITDLDPIKYDLLFERFLNPERISMPDIDVDFCYERRGEVVDYVKNMYGKESVCQIITFNKLKAKNVLRDVGRVLEIPLGEMNRIAKLVPDDLGIKLEGALKKSPELLEASKLDATHEKLFEYSLVLEGMNRNAGKHAAGVVIAPGELTDYIPLHKPTNDDSITTQYDMKYLEDVGLIKFDFLGLRTLTVIQEAVDLIKKFRNINIDISTIPMDDSKVFELFSGGSTIGLFQFESAGMREYLKKLKPTVLDDIIAMNALYRPGPMDNINDFIARKHGEQEITYLHENMAEILKDTYGIIVYQEQVMQLGTAIAGFSLAKSDLMRRAMGKKLKDLMDEIKVEFVIGAENKGIKKKIAEDIWALIDKFASYGFNKSHAAAYSVIAYQTAYLKAHFPAEFMAANMTSEGGNTDKIQTFIAECKKMGISVIPPDINTSFAEFMPRDDTAIYYGLSTIKKVGAKVAESIVKARKEKGKFTSIYDMASRVEARSINKGVGEALVGAGAMDSLPGSRFAKFNSIEDALAYGNRVQTLQNTNQVDLFGAANDNATIREPIMEEFPEPPQMETLNREREYIGFYLTGHPLDGYIDDIEAFSTIDLLDLKNVNDKQEVRLGGIISGLKIHYDKRNNPMGFFTLTAVKGQIEGLAFSKVFGGYKHIFTNDALVFAEGTISKRSEDDVKLLVNKIYPMEEARNQFARQVHLKINPTTTSPSQIDKLHGLMKRFAGGCGFYFHLNEDGQPEKTIVAQNTRVSASQSFITEMRALFGDKNVWVK